MLSESSTRPDPGPLLLLAPLSGVVVPLEQVPDAAFAQRLVGDGVSIDPTSDRVLAPCDARVLQVHRAHHAVTLLSHGLEIIIHVGLDTVMLRGEGFSALVSEGDNVRTGEALLAFDADLVARRARSLLTEVLISNVDRITKLEMSTGSVVAGRDVLLRVSLADQADDVDARAGGNTAGELLRSEPIRIMTEGGLHARPAAMITGAARHFTSDVRVVKDGREANARSVVSIMSLEVGEGDTVTIVARGSDAADAIAAIAPLLNARLAGDQRAAKIHETPLARSVQDRQSPAPGVLQGVPASPGAAVGTVFQYRHADVDIDRVASDPLRERGALDSALAVARAELDALRARLTADPNGGQGAIFAAQGELLADPELLDDVARRIRDGASAAYAWQQAYEAQANQLQGLKNELMAGRATDLRDVGRRVLHHLVGNSGGAAEVPADSILIAEDLAPSDAASFDRARVLGFCTTSGSSTSHAAILARGLGIPAVAGIDPRALDLPASTRVILDGDAGMLRTAPSDAEVREVAQRRASAVTRRERELAVATQPATTTDGHRIEVVANIGTVDDARRVVEVGAEGVGLLRTEFLFMDKITAPDEDEQAETYIAIARALGPNRILVVRTLDVGGDKPLTYLPIGAEANPFLGERGIRFALNRPALLRGQIRAILRASTSGKVAIMFPMIATIAEWRAARAMVEEERVALGVSRIAVGIMVETPAAAVIADQFAREADFLSLGTNDLTQYTLAMDRTNPRLAPNVDALHPAVLRLIERTTSGAHGHGRWAGVCGTLASDVDAIPILLGLGVDELSADLPIVPAVKARVRELSMIECQSMAREALDAPDGAAVRAIIARHRGNVSHSGE